MALLRAASALAVVPNCRHAAPKPQGMVAARRPGAACRAVAGNWPLQQEGANGALDWRSMSSMTDEYADCPVDLPWEFNVWKLQELAAGPTDALRCVHAAMRERVQHFGGEEAAAVRELVANSSNGFRGLPYLLLAEWHAKDGRAELVWGDAEGNYMVVEVRAKGNEGIRAARHCAHQLYYMLPHAKSVGAASCVQTACDIH